MVLPPTEDLPFDPPSCHSSTAPAARCAAPASNLPPCGAFHRGAAGWAGGPRGGGGGVGRGAGGGGGCVGGSDRGGGVGGLPPPGGGPGGRRRTAHPALAR